MTIENKNRVRPSYMSKQVWNLMTEKGRDIDESKFSTKKEDILATPWMQLVADEDGWIEGLDCSGPELPLTPTEMAELHAGAQSCEAEAVWFQSGQDEVDDKGMTSRFWFRFFGTKERLATVLAHTPKFRTEEEGAEYAVFRALASVIEGEDANGNLKTYGAKTTITDDMAGEIAVDEIRTISMFDLAQGAHNNALEILEGFKGGLYTVNPESK